jgi:hypothetical protein
LLVSVSAGDSPQEKAFVDSYKKAFEAKDTAALQSFLYTQGSDPGILEIYKTMQSSDAGEKISKIELIDFTAEEMQKWQCQRIGLRAARCASRSSRAKD